MKKIIFIDVDGTLTNYENKIPNSAKLAIQMAMKNGHRVYICTGRSKAEVYDEIWDIGLDGMIGGNGSYVEDSGRVIMHQLISYEQCVHIVDWLNVRGMPFYLESNNGLFASKNFEVDGLKAVKEYMDRKGKVIENYTVKDAFPTMVFDGELYRNDVNKVSFALNEYQDHLDSIVEFPDLVAHTWGGAGESALFGDLGVKNVSKSNAIETLLQHLNISKKDTIAIGDAKIDIPMLEYCEIGIAMGSGGAEIKAMADYITSGVDDDGLYRAFEYFGLI